MKISLTFHVLDLCQLNNDWTRSIQPTHIPRDSWFGLSSLCQVTHTPPTRMITTGLIFNEPPTNSLGVLLRLLISGIHPMNTSMKTKNLTTRMKTKNLILMNNHSQILNLMNNQSPGVPLAIVGAVNQAHFLILQITLWQRFFCPCHLSVLPNCLRWMAPRRGSTSEARLIRRIKNRRAFSNSVSAPPTSSKWPTMPKTHSKDSLAIRSHSNQD